ncbi:type VI secretion system protein TssA [Sphaerotilus uruguayifluvii]|uniref:Type VI secretion system protein ImpA n=1 Tax=Sphaerotilus uruguayifluvii TaxID=2735897 RepID=A0ABX2G2W0_9BURK|nr:type VI secretion system protein TssA [Leptothrix sp. C29]NRT56626.1 type VI secretion system protein ImpA [Leptothrix sp. C29]
MSSIDVDALLLPLEASAPCGETDLEYDEDFQALERAAAGRPEQQYGDTLIPAEDPDWVAMRQHALALFGRGRDLRVAVRLLRAALRLDGLGALAPGLRLVAGLLERHWDSVWPRPDPDEPDDHFMRMNALAELADASLLMADIRAARVPGDRTGLTGRQLELASGRAAAREGEPVPVAAALAPALRAAEAAQPGLLADLATLPQPLETLAAVLQRQAAAQAPELRPLRQLLQALAATVAMAGVAPGAAMAPQAAATAPDAAGTGAGAVAASPAAPTMVAVPALPPGTITSRDEALRQLERVCEWLERNEPSHPAPLLIRRAQRLMGKSFFEIVKDLASDGIESVERIAGLSYEEATGGG